MTRQHGKDVKVYFGARDASADLNEISIEATFDVSDVTGFASAGWKEGQAGLGGWTAAISGFYDAAVASYGRQMEDLLGASCGALSVYDGSADAIGDAGVLLGPGIVKARGQPISVAEMIKLNGDIEGDGRPGLFGKLLHPLGAETVTGDESSLDNGASSANGGRANLHVTAITGTWTIKVQDSENDSDWTDLVTFTAATAITAQSLEVAGTINRYARVTSTEDVAGTVTFVCGLARY